MLENSYKTIQVLIKFIRIGEIDTINEKYSAHVYIESKWNTNECITSYDPNIHWNPKLFIENTYQELRETIKYDLSIDVNGNNLITEKRIVKGYFWERLELENFPFDLQQFSITLASQLKSGELNIIADLSKKWIIDSTTSHTFVDQQKWRLFKPIKISKIPSYDTERKSNFVKIHAISNQNGTNEPSECSKIVASIYCARKANYYFFNAFFLIFLITGTAISIFSIDCKLNHNRIPSTCTFLLTSVTFKWVVNRSLPTVYYLTLLDKYSITCICFICSMATWHAIIGSHSEKNKLKEIDRWALAGFSLLFILINLCFIIRASLAYKKILNLQNEESIFEKDSRSLIIENN